MPADLNRVTLVGRLTKDPESRQTAGGTSVCSIRLAVTSRTNKGGEWSDQSNYFDVTVFGRQAESAAQYLAKGRRIGVDGRLSWREWQAQDGSKRQSVEVIANDVFVLDSRTEADREDGGGSGTWSDAAPSRPAPAADDGSDIPF
ncbi:hypothetical protein [Microcystis phage Mae-JY09]